VKVVVFGSPSRRTPPEEKLAQVFDMADAGIRLKRAALRLASRNSTEQDVDAALERHRTGTESRQRLLRLGFRGRILLGVASRATLWV
jgi:hypothetical protein